MILQLGFIKLDSWSINFVIIEVSPTLRLWPGYSAFHMPGTGKSGAPGRPWEANATLVACDPIHCFHVWNHESTIGSQVTVVPPKNATLVYYFCLRFLVMKQARLLDGVP
jgi:hypothetical protein